MKASEARLITEKATEKNMGEIFARIENAAMEGKSGFLFVSLTDGEKIVLDKLGYTVEQDPDGVWVFWGWVRTTEVVSEEQS